MKKKYNPCPVYYTTKDIRFGEVPIGQEGGCAKPLRGNLYKAEHRLTSFHGVAEITDPETGEVREEKCTVKSAKGFGDSIELAELALSHWRRLGFRGSPASAASFTREMFIKLKREKVIQSRCKASANNMLRNFFTGGWIESTTRGYVFDPIYHYDINKAYLYAAKAGLPSRLYPYTPGSNPLGFVAVMKVTSPTNKLPNFFRKYEDDIGMLVTSEEIEEYGIKGKILWGVQYYDLDVNLEHVISSLESLPHKLWKRCTQSYWGMFASYSGIDIENFNTGEERKLWNRNQNITWASLIVRRVALEVYKAMRECDGVSCFVDSVLTTKPLPDSKVGDSVGQWKLEGFYDKGILIDAAGVWHPLPFRKKSDITNKRRWKKHAGTFN